ncbi:MAG TPA: ABC transporter permease, partial [Firmicutes bacterium]|nr:ABC transporter permease [Bacillota bacterium]
ESIPVELEESAFIDGAGYLKVFRYIIWPLSKPILATIAVFGAVGHWNSFMDSLILMQGAPHLQTVQHRLFNYLNQNTNLEAIMGRSGVVQDILNTKVIKYTISMVTIIPIL